MPNPYNDGSFIWYWYEWGFPVVVAAMALAIVVSLFITTDRRPYGVIMRTLVVLALLGTIPLAEERIGIGLTASEGGMAVINILGGLGSVTIGVVHFLIYGKRRLASTQPAPGSEGAVSAAGDIEAQEPIAAAGTLDPDGSPTETLVLDDGPALPSSAIDAGATIVTPGSSVEPKNTPESLAPPAWLVFQSGPNAGQTIPLSAGGTLVGRGPENDIVIADDGVSRQHAEITFVDGQYLLTDVGSSGGTLVEGAAATIAVALESGATVRLGATDVLFMQGGPGSTTAVPTPTTPEVGDAGATLVAPPSNEPEATTVMAWLAVADGPSKGATSQIKIGQNKIGRDEGSDLLLSGRGVSRHHAMVLAEDGELTLYDYASTGGTTLNGRALEPRILSSTSRIKLGETELMLVDVAAPQDDDGPMTSDASAATMVGTPEPASAGGVLIVQAGPDAGKTFQLTEGDNVIGRSEGTILLSDPLVSRPHAVIRRWEGQFIIYDLGSTSGTVVDGVAVTGDVIKGGDRMVLGGETIVVMDPLTAQA